VDKMQWVGQKYPTTDDGRQNDDEKEYHTKIPDYIPLTRLASLHLRVELIYPVPPSLSLVLLAG